jgi:hypothetical protein
MYKLYPLGSIAHETDALWLLYEWKTFDNHEWRPCVLHFLNEVASLGHEVTLISSPPFTLGEDFIEILYLIDGNRTVFTSDHLLSLITITTEKPLVLHSVWKTIGDKIGWVSRL